MQCTTLYTGTRTFTPVSSSQLSCYGQYYKDTVQYPPLSDENLKLYLSTDVVSPRGADNLDRQTCRGQRKGKRVPESDFQVRNEVSRVFLPLFSIVNIRSWYMYM